MIGEYVCRVTGVPIASYLHSVELMVEAQVSSFLRFGYDGVGLGPDHTGLAEALGAQLFYPRDDCPQLVVPAISSYEEVPALEPPDPEKDGRLPLYLEALQRINERIGDRVRVGTGITGPFTAAAFIRGTDEFLKDLRRNPEGVHQLLELATRSIMNYMAAAHKRGFSCSMGDPLASGTVIGERHFREFVKPYLTQIVSWARDKMGKAPSLHICGDTTRIWEDMADTGVSMISVDNQVRLEDVKRAIGHRVTLKGNVPPVEVLLAVTPRAVLAAGAECIREAGDNPCGFVLSSGCTIALNTPPANLDALIDAARLYGRRDGLADLA